MEKHTAQCLFERFDFTDYVLFYKYYFYKQRQAEIDKKASKCKATP